jgi:hypothetical protein
MRLLTINPGATLLLSGVLIIGVALVAMIYFATIGYELGFLGSLILGFIALVYIVACGNSGRILGFTNPVIRSSEFWNRSTKWRNAAIQKFQWDGLTRGYFRDYVRDLIIVEKVGEDIGRVFSIFVEPVDDTGRRMHFLEVRCGTGRRIVIPIDINEVRELQFRSQRIVPAAVAAQAWIKGETPDTWEPPLLRT